MTDTAGVLRSANAALARWCGRDTVALVGRPLRHLVVAEDVDPLGAALDPLGPAHVEVRLLTPGGPR